jgi:hypothetical protein
LPGKDGIMLSGLFFNKILSVLNIINKSLS